MNKPLSSLLALPALPVSVMRGKKAARAAPMLALAAMSCCSAARISGRTVSKSDGKPGRQFRSRDIAARVVLVSGPAGRVWPTSKRQQIEVLGALALSCCASTTRALSSSDNPCCRSSLETTPLSYFSSGSA